MPMPHKYWLRFHEPDGQVRIEMLGPPDDFAELVDPNDGSLLHSEPFALHGGEWRIENVTVMEDMIRIECISTSAQLQFGPPAPSPRSSIRR